MKSCKSIGLFFVMTILMMTMLGFGYFLGMAKSKKLLNEKNAYEKNAYEKNAYNAPSNSNAEELPFASFLDVSSDSGLLRQNTEFVILEVDDELGETREEARGLPEQYVGLDLDGFLSAMEQYNKKPPLSEKQRGFTYLEVLRFSRDRVVIRKHYEKKAKETGYYLAIMEGKVVVLTGDGQSLYMDTDISVFMLPEEIREELTNMIYVEDDEALFDFLEGYTS